MGSLYRDGVGPLFPNGRCMDEDFTLGDTTRGRELEWVKAGRLLVAAGCVCRNVTWYHLNKLGYISGVPVTIDGRRYLCRSLHVGEDDEGHDEWAELLNTYGKSDKIWHWKRQFFWGQDIPAGGKTDVRFARGYGPALSSISFDAGGHDDVIGFRPVLEPLYPQLKLSEACIGKQVDVCVGIVGFKGQLRQFDDYDIVLSVEGKLPVKFDWVVQKGEMVTISRLANIAIWEV